ncbi:MAG: amidohydrolase family protein [Veillonella sp.]|uniref:amidohydrolase family protein n=1 Tax=Veillonella sp. TaxID=1926307 RepID=UPI0025FDDD15|nr:amidohydrolase family protein [Veillonella sp.]MBS4912993.1 amidohydrolase family protein [Veillonella sp.]
MDATRIVIKNAKVVDPKTETIEQRNIYINGKYLVKPFDIDEKVHEIDASGCYVFPGLVDHHTHVFYGGSHIGVKPDWLIPYGVTSMADAGTSGCANYKNFYLLNVLSSAVTVKTYLNIFSGGQLAVTLDENFDPKLYDIEHIKEVVETYKDNIIGFKIRFSRGLFPDGAEGLAWLDKVYELIDQVNPNLSLCIHMTDMPSTVDQLLQRMRKGDIFCHCYHGKGNTILTEDSKVAKAVWEAKKRGVIFDVANGRTGFAFAVAEQAMKDGLYPDIISTDTTQANFNTPGYTSNLLFLVSKFVNMGMSLPAVVKAVTYTPAQAIHEPLRGGLDEGMYADIAIVKEVNEPIEYLDVRGEVRTGNSYFTCKATLLNGSVVYRENGF